MTSQAGCLVVPNDVSLSITMKILDMYSNHSNACFTFFKTFKLLLHTSSTDSSFGGATGTSDSSLIL